VPKNKPLNAKPSSGIGSHYGVHRCANADTKGKAMTLPTPLPILGLTEQQMIDYADTSWVARVRPTMGKEYSREWLETALRQGLREGALMLTIKAVEAAETKDDPH
jgi:hypothetical protein